MSLIKSDIVKLSPYSVAQDGAATKLNQNESPWDVASDLKNRILTELRGCDWNRYPSGEAEWLREALARYTRHPASGIVVGNGSNELIHMVASATCSAGDRIVTVEPGFSVYGRVASVLGAQAVKVPLREDFSFDIEALIEAGHGARLMFLACPNSPTGTMLGVKEIGQIAGGFSGMLAVDEAYFEFSGQTALPLLANRQNVVILRTFSKALGSAGLRLGYLLARPDTARELEKAKLPFSVGLFQQIAGKVILSEARNIESRVDAVVTERERVLRALKSLPGLEPVPSRANFILFASTRQPAIGLYEKLKRAGILVRHFDSPRLENMLRVTIGQREENDRFLASLSGLLGEGKP
jgi:histidinol-phosphate aminotransferase